MQSPGHEMGGNMAGRGKPKLMASASTNAFAGFGWSGQTDFLNKNTGILHDLIMAVVVEPMMRLRMWECP